MRTYLSFYVLRVVLLVHIWPWNVLFNCKPRVSDLDGQTWHAARNKARVIHHREAFHVHVLRRTPRWRRSPYSRSRRHVWQTFLILLQVWQTSVFLKRIRDPGHHRKTVNGRAQICWAKCITGKYLPVQEFTAEHVLHFSRPCTPCHTFPWSAKQSTSRSPHAWTRERQQGPFWSFWLTIRMYGFSPRHVWHRIGKSWNTHIRAVF